MNFKHISLFLILFASITYAQKPTSLIDKAYKELENENYKNSINLYTQLLNQEPNNILYLQNRAFCFHELKLYSHAIKDCNKALSLKPYLEDKYNILQIRASSYNKLEKWQKAYEDYDNCSAYYYDNIDIDLARAYTIYKLEKYEKAIKSYNYILTNQKPSKEQIIDSYYWLGLCYINLDSISLAKEYYKKLIALDSISNSRLYLLAAINWSEDKTEETINCYTKILSTDSNDVCALLNRGIQYTYDKKYDLAIKDLKKHASINPNSNNGMYELGIAYTGVKNYNMAIYCFNKCLKNEPNSSKIYNQISWTYFLSANYTKGLKYANKAILLDEKNENATDTRGCILYKLNVYTSAIKDFNKTLSIDSLYTNSYYYRALCYIKTNDFTKACADLQKVILHKDYSPKEGEKPAELLIKEICN